MNKFNQLFNTLMEEVSTHLDSENKLSKPESSENSESSSEVTECCDMAAGIDVGSVMRTCNT